MLKNSRRLQKGETTQRAGSLGAQSSNDAGRAVSIAAPHAMQPWSPPSHARRVHQIAVRETFVAYNHGTAHDRDGAIEDRAIVHERVELPVIDRPIFDHAVAVMCGTGVIPDERDR